MSPAAARSKYHTFKTGVEHVVPSSNAALAILASLPRVAGKGGYILSTNGETPISGFAKAKEQLDDALPPDMPGWTIHDIRRSFTWRRQSEYFSRRERSWAPSVQ